MPSKRDLRSRFESAAQTVEEVKHFRKITKGKNKGEDEYVYSQYKINDSLYDWYDIVDLRKWICG